MDQTEFDLHFKDRSIESEIANIEYHHMIGYEQEAIKRGKAPSSLVHVIVEMRKTQQALARLSEADPGCLTFGDLKANEPGIYANVRDEILSYVRRFYYSV